MNMQISEEITPSGKEKVVYIIPFFYFINKNFIFR